MAYRFHAYKSERLYKEKGNDAKVVGKFIQFLLTNFDATHSVTFARVTNLQTVFYLVCQLFGITHRLIITYHPHLSGQKKMMNLVIKRILEKMIDQSLKDWSTKID